MKEAKTTIESSNNLEVLKTAQIAFFDALETFYKQYNPANLSRLQENLAKYSTNEDKLVEALELKYNVEMPKYVHIIAKIVSNSTEQILFEPLEKELEDSFYAGLNEFYLMHNPTNVDKIQENLKKFRGKEKDMLAALEKKYKTTVPGSVHVVAQFLQRAR